MLKPYVVHFLKQIHQQPTLSVTELLKLRDFATYLVLLPKELLGEEFELCFQLKRRNRALPRNYLALFAAEICELDAIFVVVACFLADEVRIVSLPLQGELLFAAPRFASVA